MEGQSLDVAGHQQRLAVGQPVAADHDVDRVGNHFHDVAGVFQQDEVHGPHVTIGTGGQPRHTAEVTAPEVTDEVRGRDDDA